MFYESVNSVIYTLLIWWIIFLVFQRIMNRYPKSNTWKKDIILTFGQSAIVLAILPFLVEFLRS
jgi:hypothetical protein